MTPPMQPDIAGIARGLSQAQRRAVLILSDQWASRMRPESMVWLEPRLLEIGVPLRSGHERVRLTPLGLAVRDHLLSKDKTDV